MSGETAYDYAQWRKRCTYGEWLDELLRSYPAGLVERMEKMTDDERRAELQWIVQDLGADFAPDPVTVKWLLKMAGVDAHAPREKLR